ncbi:uncharacterized protein LOC128206994 isoform X2 [Mya arenaria]|uniref:uncharacterized protein LOC128206994 isoform X2 n=1 Tax=Mya arenaria TaxID=6604 RepID=UPI0022E1FCDE|nr:uncharacterized protein LOC128206994 isoform X2 [Mya arenaria]
MDLIYFRKIVILLAVAQMNGGFGAGDQEGCAHGASNYTFIERAVESVKKNVMVYRLVSYKPSCDFIGKLIDMINNKCKEKTRIVSQSEPKYHSIISTTHVTKCCIGFITENDICVRVKSNNFPTGALTGGVIGAVIVLGAAVVITFLVTRRLLQKEAQGHNDERDDTNPGGAATQPGLYESLNIASMEERDRGDAFTVLFTTGQAGVPESDHYETIPN